MNTVVARACPDLACTHLKARTQRLACTSRTQPRDCEIQRRHGSTPPCTARCRNSNPRPRTAPPWEEAAASAVTPRVATTLGTSPRARLSVAADASICVAPSRSPASTKMGASAFRICGGRACSWPALAGLLACLQPGEGEIDVTAWSDDSAGTGGVLARASSSLLGQHRRQCFHSHAPCHRGPPLPPLPSLSTPQLACATSCVFPDCLCARRRARDKRSLAPVASPRAACN